MASPPLLRTRADACQLRACVDINRKKIKEAFSLEKKISNTSECRMSHHRIKNIFQSEKRPDFDVKILKNDFFNKYVV